jgi:hypothetical protein
MNVKIVFIFAQNNIVVIGTSQRHVLKVGWNVLYENSSDFFNG